MEAVVGVRFGSQPDIEVGPRDVRFTPECGHQGMVRTALAAIKEKSWIAVRLGAGGGSAYANKIL